MDFVYVAAVLAEVRDTGSTNLKKQLLKTHDCEDLRKVLFFIYNPYFKTNIGRAKLERASVANEDYDADEIMAYLRCNNTGTDYNAAACNSFIYAQETEDTTWLATGLVMQDLQIGVSVTTLNKLFGKTFIPKVGIMRGMLAPEDFNGIYIATEKIDGNRRLLFTHEAGPKMYSRTGRPDDGLVEILEQARNLPTGYVYDCECVAIGDFADSIAQRQATESIMSKDGIRTGIKAKAFDMLPIPEYEDGKSLWPATYRKALLALLFNDCKGLQKLGSSFNMSGVILDALNERLKGCNTGERQNIVSVPIEGIVHNYTEAIELAKPIWDRHYEGLMLVEYRSPYEVNPNPRPTLLKIKATQEFVCRCVGVEEGSNKYEGMLGAIIVEYKRKDDSIYSVKVGTGFTDSDRISYFDNPEQIVGKMVEIESFGESQNMSGGYSLNCPVFKRIKGEE